MSTETETALAAAIESEGLTMSAVYVVPQHVDQDTRLHWKVAFKWRDRDLMEFDYWAGQGHCPSYSRSIPGTLGAGTIHHIRRQCIEAELQTGFEHRWDGFNARLRMVDSDQQTSDGRLSRKRVAILPRIASVVKSIQLDSQAGELAFEDMCGEFGYESDSRKSYDMWLTCVDTAAKWRRLPQAIRDRLETLLADY